MIFLSTPNSKLSNNNPCRTCCLPLWRPHATCEVWSRQEYQYCSQIVKSWPSSGQWPCRGCRKNTKDDPCLRSLMTLLWDSPEGWSRFSSFKSVILTCASGYGDSSNTSEACFEVKAESWWVALQKLLCSLDKMLEACRFSWVGFVGFAKLCDGRKGVAFSPKAKLPGDLYFWLWSSSGSSVPYRWIKKKINKAETILQYSDFYAVVITHPIK